MTIRYLGVMRGVGTLTGGEGEDLGRAEYDIDGFLTRTGEIVASGELRMDAEALTLVFGRVGLRLLTEDGQRLSVRFSGKRPGEAGNAAHVDVTEGLPSAKKWRH
jgi:hypothetical protein